ncbi:putative neurotrophin receptor LTRK 1 [Folsomia candida]|uniref:Putative neurotrophin receptor LTRK 1 n=1 Tax=Folsomia candida TaxID=158441 RepID=A0A226EWQ1_FOLCA|nr:putative neurotrophin receptor LTRK 1 [Folsomia candida]
MSAVIVVIVLVVIFVAVGVGVICTWSWWKRWLNRCLSNGDSPPDARWEPGPPTFEQLDPTALDRSQRNRDGSVIIDPLPNLRDLNIDPRESFELRRTKFPQGIIPIGGESSVHAHDWFHPPYESFPKENLEYIKVIGKGWFGKVIETDAKNISPMTKSKKVIVKQLRDDANDHEQMHIAKAMEYLFALHFVHEDLSARNCMVGNVAGRIILGDNYGLAPSAFPRDYYKISNMAIPIRWAAPEAFEFKEGTCTPLQITQAANIWSYAVVLFELYSFSKMPYLEMSDEEVIRGVLVNKSYLMEPPNFPFVNDSTKDRLYKLMLSCWNRIPENRPTIHQVLEIMSTP